MQLRIAIATLLVLVILGCSGGETEPLAPEPCLIPNRMVGERCLAPGIADDGCPAGTLGQPDGSCRPAGMLPEDCAEGFVHVPFDTTPDDPLAGGGWCEPILPAEPCPPGLMAVPGDTACRPVMDCGSGKWGDIPVDATTQYVDQSFTGVSTGSSDAPWTTIGDAVTAAPHSGLIAVAAGSYHEDVVIEDEPLRLHGVCPAQVELVGTGAGIVTSAALRIGLGASGSEVRGLAVRGAAVGVWLIGSEQVLLDRLWVHDNASRGIHIEASFGPTSCTVRFSLVEQNHHVGVLIASSAVTVESTVVRGTQPDAQGLGGRGIHIQPHPVTGLPSTATLRALLVEQNHDIGVSVIGSEAAVEVTVVRNTLPNAQGLNGHGIGILHLPVTGLPSTAILRACLVEQNHGLGVLVEGSEGTVETTIVRGTQPDGQGFGGRGISIHSNLATGLPSTATLRASLIEQNHDVGVFIDASAVTVEGTVVRGTQPDGQGTGGAGIAIQSAPATLMPSTATLRASLVEQNHVLGVFIAGSEATVEGTVVRGTQPDGQGLFGRGISIQSNLVTSAPSTATLRASRVEQNHELGVFVMGSEVNVEGTVVRGTQPDGQGFVGRGIVIQNAAGAPSTATLRTSLVEQNHDLGVSIIGSKTTIEDCHIVTTQPNSAGRFGDGLLIMSDPDFDTFARVFVDNTRIDDSARAGLSNFGAFVSLQGVSIGCAKWQLEGEPHLGWDFAFENRGDNACGCPEVNDECVAVSIGYEPPEPIEPSEPID